MDNVEWLMDHAKALSNLNRPESDNNYGRTATEIKDLRKRVDLLEIENAALIADLNAAEEEADERLMNA